MFDIGSAVARLEGMAMPHLAQKTILKWRHKSDDNVYMSPWETDADFDFVLQTREIISYTLSRETAEWPHSNDQVWNEV